MAIYNINIISRRYFSHAFFGRLGSVLFFFLLYPVMLFSQPISLPYYCGFEDTVENTNWMLNYGPLGSQCEDLWMIGNAARSEGRTGLYISTDGITADYGCSPNVVVAYREFSLAERTNCDISFDWRTNGLKGKSELYVAVLNQVTNVPPSDPHTAIVPSDITQWKKLVLNDTIQWKNASFTQVFPANQTFKLVFAWVNSNTDSLPSRIGACIDNIQITANNCKKPYDFLVDTSICDTTKLSWRGVSPLYEIEYKSRSQLQWRTLAVQEEETAEVIGLAEGMYDFRVRGICINPTTNDTTFSAFQTKNSVILFCPENHCINYVDLNGPSVKAWVGTYDSPKNESRVVDYGSDSPSSRHTIHWTPDEYDPRTYNSVNSRGHAVAPLKTIPEDEFASVRLGNWESNALAECIAFNYFVDASSSLLLMNYAIVMVDPTNHSNSQKPHFTLEIRDSKGQLVDPTCGIADFHADYRREGWNHTISGHDIVTWKDWTTVGLNLEKYIGQNISIELTTKDCSLGAHYGYAYFTLDCMSAKIQTNSCGDSPQISISAPPGFTYEWTNPKRPGWKWNQMELEIDATDTTTYYCQVCYKEENSCCFELSTQAYPRFPIAEFDYTIATEECKNIIRFENLSHIMTRYDGNEEHTTEPCESYFWEFGNKYHPTSREHPELEVSTSGGTLDVTLTAYLAGVECSKDTTIRIIVPSISNTADTIPDFFCAGGHRFLFGGKHFTNAPGFFSDSIKNAATGCLDITVIDLFEAPVFDFAAVEDTICFGEEYFFINNYYTAAQDTIIEVYLKTCQYECDSIHTLKLHVRGEITFEAIATDVLEGPNSGRIEIVNTSISDYEYSLNGVMNAPLTGLSGGSYTLILYNKYGCSSLPCELQIKQDCLEVLMDEAPHICSDDPYFELPYTIEKGWATLYDVQFSEQAKRAGFVDMDGLSARQSPVKIPLPAGVRPDSYEVNIIFEDLPCSPVHNQRTFTVNYPSSIISQKWNDVLAVYNSAFNGGYEFSAYQWYRNGEIIEGETNSYLYLRDEELDFTSEYTLLLTRADDGKSFFTCSFIPERKEDISLYPTILQHQAPAVLNISRPASISIYDSMGLKQREVKVQAGQGQNLYIADKPGYYFINIRLDNGENYPFKVIIIN